MSFSTLSFPYGLTNGALLEVGKGRVPAFADEAPFTALLYLNDSMLQGCVYG